MPQIPEPTPIDDRYYDAASLRAYIESCGIKVEDRYQKNGLHRWSLSLNIPDNIRVLSFNLWPKDPKIFRDNSDMVEITEPFIWAASWDNNRPEFERAVQEWKKFQLEGKSIDAAPVSEPLPTVAIPSRASQKPIIRPAAPDRDARFYSRTFHNYGNVSAAMKAAKEREARRESAASSVLVNETYENYCTLSGGSSNINIQFTTPAKYGITSIKGGNGGIQIMGTGKMPEDLSELLKEKKLEIKTYPPKNGTFMVRVFTPLKEVLPVLSESGILTAEVAARVAELLPDRSQAIT